MANTKISALTAATTPVAGTETLPIVQGGSTKQVSIANLTAGRAVSALSMTLTNALAIASGGTNSTSTPTAGAVIYGNGSAYAVSAAGTSGQVLISGGSGAPTWTGGPTFTATTKVSMTEAYFGLDAGTLGTGKLWYLISGGGGNVTSGYFSIWNGTNGNKVFSIAPSTSEQFTTDTSGNFNMVAGNVVQGTAGKGYNFTANSVAAGSTTQLFNWYDTGTFTPTFTNLTVVGTPTYTGTYTRIGRMVYVNIRIQSTGSTSSTAGTTYANAGFPYVSANIYTAGRTINTGTGASFTTESIFGLSGGNTIVYTATWSALADVTITGFYFV